MAIVINFVLSTFITTNATSSRIVVVEMTFFLVLILWLISGCNSNVNQAASIANPLDQGSISTSTTGVLSEVDQYAADHPNSNLSSASFGTTDKGSMTNGKLLPFQVGCLTYFDTSSYLAGRAYINDQLLLTTKAVADTLSSWYPERNFCIMETGFEKGGPLPPHRTHQNGLSMDVMIPLKKGDQPFYDLDGLGAPHYGLEFDNRGQLRSNTEVVVDFETLGGLIYAFQLCAKNQNMCIAKVLLKTEFKALLFNTVYGKKLLKEEVYFAQSLTPMINSLHDDHVHLDFKFKSTE